MRTAALAAALLVTACVGASSEPSPSPAVPSPGRASVDRPSVGTEPRQRPIVDDDPGLSPMPRREVRRPAVVPPAAHAVEVIDVRPRPSRVAVGVQGVASWYCGHGSACTRGHAGGLFAAIRRDLLAHLRGRLVQVCVVGTNRCVDVRVIDCNCGPDANLIDLYSDAFSRLAPLSRGVVKVTVTWGK